MGGSAFASEEGAGLDSSTLDAGALPVALELPGPHGDGVRRWVEGVLGWQPVDGAGETLVPAVLRLVDVSARAPVAPNRIVPTVLVVSADDPPVAVAVAGSGHAPAAVVTWPDDRDRLPAVVADVLATPRPTLAGGAGRLRVGGTGGGVGTTTVALALAGLAAWRGHRVLAVLREQAPVEGARRLPAAALASHDLWGQSTPLPGIPGARAVVIPRDAAPHAAPSGLDGAMAVVDVGVEGDVDVLVVRPDRAGIVGVGATAAGAIVVVGEGAASHRALQRACGPRRVLHVPWSARVARAGLKGRVPGGLPGAWLRQLAPLAPGRATVIPRSEDIRRRGRADRA